MKEGYKVLFKDRYGYEFKSISIYAKEVKYKVGKKTVRPLNAGPLAVFKDYDSALEFSKGAFFQYVAKCMYKESKELCLYNLPADRIMWKVDCPENTVFADEVIIDEIVIGPTLEMEHDM